MPDRTSHEPGTISWTDLATTDADGREGVLRRAVRLGVRRAAGRRGQDLLDGEARRPRRGGDLARSSPTRRRGHPAALERLRHRRRRRRDAGEGLRGGRQRAGRAVRRDDAGRMSVVADPTGAVVCLWQAGDQHRRRGRQRARRAGWADTATTDAPAAQGFYAALLGWRFDQMSEAPPYWVIFNGERIERRHDRPAAGRAAQLVPLLRGGGRRRRRSRRRRSAGGNPFLGPIDVPGGRFALIMDPQGAAFAVLSRRTSTTSA